ncbi:D-alanyl carrier protein [Kitasatospora sp. MMS16-BH015]|uniref:acyl carrier protein n=1 Tax=Kitasatospora sp. MMS16-BH015 TaxID=2018025 RepID=UPI000CA1156B|nr:acyl carrier protein [Kitasatospora sp. MMS16-BH015]AUG75706.1 D-alanyl carrier protein [Kitasatospora sp. MMS16-BH015]
MTTVLGPDEIRERTRAYLSSSLARQLADDEDIFAAGLVNSLFAAQLVTFVEERFGITVENDELELAHFSSVDAVTAFVSAKTASGGAR